MVLDSKIAMVRDHFGIRKLDDWTKVSPAEVLAIDGVGQATLNILRLYLAGRSVSLKDDGSPQYWFQHLSHARIGARLSDEETAVASEFEILVDGRERAPFRFMDMKAKSADGEEVPLLPNMAFATLETGDYSIRGMESMVCVERKSLEDLYSTLGQGRERFEREHYRMSLMKSAVVVIEADWSTAIQHPPPQSKLNPSSVVGTQISWFQRYGVPWMFMPGRRAAEVYTYKFLDMFYRQSLKKERE